MAIQNMSITDYASEVMLGFFRRAGFLKALSTIFKSEFAKETGATIKVPLITANTALEYNATDGYKKQDPNIAGVDVAMQAPIYVPTTWENIATMNAGGAKRYSEKVRADGAAIANMVWDKRIKNILDSEDITATQTIVASTFDADDLADLSALAKATDDGASEWTVVLDDSLFAGLLKDERVSKACNYGSDEALKTGELPKLFGIGIASAPIFKAGGKTYGYLVSKSAIAFASQAVLPALPAVANMVEKRTPIIDPDTSLAMVLKEYYTPSLGAGQQNLEFWCGAKLAQAKGVIKLVIA